MMQQSAKLYKLNAHPQCFTAENDFVCGKHWQKEIEAVYIAQGWLDIFVDEHIYHLSQGEIIFIKSGVVHSFLEKQKHGVIKIVKFTTENIINPCFEDSTNQTIERLYDQIFTVHCDDTMMQIINDMYGRNFFALNECYITSKLMELTVHILTNPSLIFNKTPSEGVDHAEYLDDIFNYLEAHVEEKITLQNVADYVGITNCYCSKYIKQKTGMTFTEYLNVVRITRAETFLIKTKKNITEISFQTGFNSIQTFNRVFRKMKNMSPREYRRYRYDKS